MQRQSLKVVGLMSGTSVDTLDLALIEITPNSQTPPKLLEYREHGYSPELRKQLIDLSCNSSKASVSLDDFSRLNSWLGFHYGKEVLSFLEEIGCSPNDIDLIGSHGQTIAHTPDISFDFLRNTFLSAPASLQIGDGDCIAKTTGITTVSDFRMADIASGGEGAPLCPIGHQLFFGNAAPKVVVVNLGGICNITCMDQGNQNSVVAFDTGPANMVMDGLMTAFSNGTKNCDSGGEMAQKGVCDMALLELFLKNPYFVKKPPKSCGRAEFGEPVIKVLLDKSKTGMRPEDAMRTALELTVVSLRNAIREQMKLSGSDLVVCMGGGAQNPFLMGRIAEEVAPAQVRASDEFGVKASAFEAICFGWLAYLCVSGQPFPLPTVTGAKKASIYGKISPGNPEQFRKLIAGTL